MTQRDPQTEAIVSEFLGKLDSLRSRADSVWCSLAVKLGPIIDGLETEEAVENDLATSLGWADAIKR